MKGREATSGLEPLFASGADKSPKDTAPAFLTDPDFTLWNGDSLEVLRSLPAESVDCCITSPPYWGLRDYGTGQWEGGDPECDHAVRIDPKIESSTLGGGKGTTGHQREGFRESCPRCGATRRDSQLGLEPSPEEYVARMVEVFREVRRVLASHGTCWLNLGDSYVSDPGKGGSGTPNGRNNRGEEYGRERMAQVRDGKAVHGDVLRPFAVEGLRPKNLCGIPWRVAFALQADGWFLRSDIVWSKPNPMPESVTDRPTKAHEYVFMLSKQPRYFFDQEAVREKWADDRMGASGARPGTPESYAAQAGRGGDQGLARFNARGPDGRHKTTVQAGDGSIQHRAGERWPNSGRNIRSVWEIATQSFPEAHFATFPEELVRRCLLAGCPEQVCGECGKARERVVEAGPEKAGIERGQHPSAHRANLHGPQRSAKGGLGTREYATLGFTDCGHDAYRPGIVLDPFMGSGTVALVARKHGRRAVGIELSADYCAMAAKRLQQQSLFAEAS